MERHKRSAQTDVQSEQQPRAPAQQVATDQGNAANQEDAFGPLADKLPEELDLEGLGVRFDLPANTDLTGTWNQLMTTSRTTVQLQLTARALEIRFWPGLVADVQWPLSNVAWRGLTFDLASGEISDVDVDNTQLLAFGAEGLVDGRIREFVGGLVAGTPLAAGGYDPFQDANPGATVQRLRENVTANASQGGGDLKPSAITAVTPFAAFETTREIRQGTDEGGVHIPGGTALNAAVRLRGNAAEIAGAGGLPELDWVSLTTDGVVLEHEGEPIAKLLQLSVRHGGAVDVSRYEPLGRLKEAGDTESGLKGLFLLFQLAAMRENVNPGPLVTNLDPTLVDGIATNKMEEALTTALHQLLELHHDAVPGVDLRQLLGVQAQQE